MRILSQLSRRSARRKGLTLIEILVVSVIFAIIATSLFIVFKAGLESWRRTQGHLEVYQNARSALDMMTRDLSAAYLNSGNAAITFKGYHNGGTPPPWGWKANSGGDEVYFIAALNPTLNNASAKFELCQVGYWLDSSKNELNRYYYAQVGAAPDYDFSSGNGASSKVAFNVTGLTLQYYGVDSNGNAVGPYTTWDSTSVSPPPPVQLNMKPTKVEITLTLRDPSTAKAQKLSAGVCIPQ